MLYMGTNVTYGRGTGVVIATEWIPRWAPLPLNLPLQREVHLRRKLNQISNILSIGVIGIAIAIFIVGQGYREP